MFYEWISWQYWLIIIIIVIIILWIFSFTRSEKEFIGLGNTYEPVKITKQEEVEYLDDAAYIVPLNLNNEQPKHRRHNALANISSVNEEYVTPLNSPKKNNLFEY